MKARIIILVTIFSFLTVSFESKASCTEIYSKRAENLIPLAGGVFFLSMAAANDWLVTGAAASFSTAAAAATGTFLAVWGLNNFINAPGMFALMQDVHNGSGPALTAYLTRVQELISPAITKDQIVSILENGDSSEEFCQSVILYIEEIDEHVWEKTGTPRPVKETSPFPYNPHY
jgi:hypothetical protein